MRSQPVHTGPKRPLRNRYKRRKAAQSLDKKRKRIGNACEKAKHHLNPSSDQPKNDAFATTRVRTVLFETVKKKQEAGQSLDKKRGATQPGQRQKSSPSAMHAKQPNTT